MYEGKCSAKINKNESFTSDKRENLISLEKHGYETGLSTMYIM